MEIATKVGQAVLEKALTEGGKGTGATGGAGESNFSKLLTEKLDGHKISDQISQSFGLSPEKQMQGISAEGLDIKASQITVNQEIRTHGKALQILSEVNRGALQMEDIMKVATSGKNFSPAELLGLQAGMHQIVLQTEMTMKVAEQGTASFKQINQTQI